MNRNMVINFQKNINNMEEKKEKKETKKVDKLTYEQLENVAHQLSSQNRELYTQLQKAKQVIATFNELNYLFKVVEFKNSFSKEFSEMCISEIESIMTPDEEPKEEKDN